MDTTRLLLLCLTVAGISAGQILFKLAAESLPSRPQVWDIALNYFTIAAITLYAAITLLWIFLLKGGDLSKTYPVMSLSFVLVPAASWFVFGETLDRTNVLGLGFIVVGVILATR
jgi:drug/metabolite transporter (DMT)-like permease